MKCLAYGPNGERCRLPIHMVPSPDASRPVGESHFDGNRHWFDGLRLDLGSGATPAGTTEVVNGPDDGPYVGVDYYCGTNDGSENGILAVDLFRTPWPWYDESIDAIWMCHFVEHFPPNYWDPTTGRWRYPFIEAMTEMYRILKPGAIAHITWPYLKSERAFQDPTHNDFIPATRWQYLNREWRVTNNLDHPPYPVDVDFTVAGLAMPDPHARFRGRVQATVDAALEHYWEAVPEMRVMLIKGPAPDATGEPDPVPVEGTGG